MSKNDFPFYSGAAKTGDKGMRIVEEIVSDQLGWLLRPQEGQKDLGIDAHIELLGPNGEAFGKLLAAQVKCGKSFLKVTNADGYVFYGEKKHLNYYINYSIPVLLILCNPETKECWWCEIEPLETEQTETGWQITVPFDQCFDMNAKEALTKLAGPSQNYHEELEHYWQVNELLTMPKTFTDIVIAREDIEGRDTSRVLPILERFCISKKVARNNREKLSVSVYGYEEDERELYEIPEVREWFSQICEEFHYWFYFLLKEIGSLKLIVLCISPYTRILNSQVEIDTTRLGPFLTQNFAGLNEMCYFTGIDEDEIREISRRVFLSLFPDFYDDPLAPI